MTQKKLKVSMVSYLNSKPFILGLELNHMMDEIELHLEVPSKTAEKLIKNKVDVALVPVAVLPQIDQFKLITDYCIGADGQVRSVMLFSQVPVNQIQEIHLDSHSRTSSNLLKILLREYWQQEVHFIEDSEVEADFVKGTSACLMIGDKAISQQNKFKYQFDLAQHWKTYTGLPFAFAVWIGKNELPQIWEEKLNKSFSLGLQQLEKIAPLYQHQFPDFDINHYLKHSIDFDFNLQKAKALDSFLGKMKQIPTEKYQ